MIDHETRRKIRKEIAEFVKSHGANTAAIAAATRKFKRAEHTVRTACRENGVSVARGTSGPVPLGSNTYDIVAALCTTDDSYEVIGERFQVTRQWVGTVYRRCRKAGVPVRPRGRKS